MQQPRIRFESKYFLDFLALEHLESQPEQGFRGP